MNKTLNKACTFKINKNMKRLLYINLIFATLLFSTGCKKGFLSDLAVNPNQPSQAPASLLLPPILTGYASNIYFSSSTIGLWMGYYSVSGGYSVTTNQETYYVSAAGPSNWDNLYSILKNAAYIEKQSASDPNGDYSVAVAKILKAYGFQMIVDAYGTAPYSEAFLGSANFFPKYDDGQSIYDSSIAQLDLAINLIANAPTTTTNLGNNDIMFGGDMGRWARFANTLKLRYIIRQSNIISASDAQSEIAKTASTGYLTADALVNPGYLNSAGKQNPYWMTYGVDAGGSLYSDGYNFLRGGAAAVNFFSDNNVGMLVRRLGSVASPNFTMFRTFDGGATWDAGTPSTAPLGSGSYAYIPGSQVIVKCSADQANPGSAYSEDNGATWSVPHLVITESLILFTIDVIKSSSKFPFFKLSISPKSKVFTSSKDCPVVGEADK